MRDPLTDPRKGDVVRWPGAWRNYEIARVDSDVLVYGHDRGRMIPMSVCCLSYWPKLAAGGTVVRVAHSEASGIRKRGGCR